MKSKFILSFFVSMALVFSLVTISAFTITNYTGTGYGNPSGIFSINQSYFNLGPSNQDVIFQLNVNKPNSYIFRVGYFWNFRLNKWIPFEFNQPTIGGSYWISNSANKNLTITARDNLRNGYNYVLTYSCEKVSGTWGNWKCGCEGSSDTRCNKWMLQVFNLTGVDLSSVPASSCATDYDCSSSAGEVCMNNVCVVSASPKVGTKANPYNISTCLDLQAMKNDLSAYYVLINNVDCSVTRNWNCGSGYCLGFEPVGNSTAPFTGNLDGRGKVINGLFINRTQSGIGLFGETLGVEIANLGLKDFEYNVEGMGDFIGGLVGMNRVNVNKGKLEKVFVNGRIISSLYISRSGGLVGNNLGAEIINSYADVDISYPSLGSMNGGIIGGLVGSNSGVINNSYSRGNVTGRTQIGGFSGILSGKISNSFSLGLAIANGYAAAYLPRAGDLISDVNIGALISNSYAMHYVGSSNNCVAVGSSSGCNSVSDLSYFKSATNAPLNTWDFTNVWAINPTKNGGYPYLKWQNP